MSQVLLRVTAETDALTERPFGDDLIWSATSPRTGSSNLPVKN